MILQNTRLKNKLTAIVAENKEIIDILVFGSVIRGKENPNDTDILILFSHKVDKDLEYTIRKIIEEAYKNVSLISKTERGILDDAFDAREAVLFEGKSLITGKNIAQNYGFLQFGMFKYSFAGWNKLKKTKFYYALHGRGNSKGMSEKTAFIKLADSVILVPLEKIEDFKQFLESWKIKYLYVPVLIPNRMGRNKILGG